MTENAKGTGLVNVLRRPSVMVVGLVLVAAIWSIAAWMYMANRHGRADTAPSNPITGPDRATIGSSARGDAEVDGVKLYGVVTSPDGTPFANEVVELWRSDDRMLEERGKGRKPLLVVRTGAGGEYEFSALPSDLRYEVRIPRYEDYFNPERDPRLFQWSGGGKFVQLDIDLKGCDAPVFSVRVSSRGQFASRGWISSWVDQRYGARRNADEDGWLRFGGAPQGVFVFNAVWPNFDGTEIQAFHMFEVKVDPSQGDSELELEIPFYSVRGKVIGIEGSMKPEDCEVKLGYAKATPSGFKIHSVLEYKKKLRSDFTFEFPFVGSGEWDIYARGTSAGRRGLSELVNVKLDSDVMIDLTWTKSE